MIPVQRIKVVILSLFVVLTCGVLHSKVIHEYEPEPASSFASRVDKDCVVDQQEPEELVQEEEELQGSEDWRDWGWRQAKNAMYAGTVVVGATAVAAATGGVGALIALKAGVGAVTIGTGAAAGGATGVGYGVGMALSEFGKKKPSVVSRAASEVGKVATLTVAVSPLMGVPACSTMATSLWNVNSALKLAGFATGYVVGKSVASDSK